MVDFDPAARASLDAYLAAIASTLERNGHDPEEIDTIIGAVEERVLETATDVQRTDAVNMRAFLRTLDEPQAYATTVVEAEGSAAPGRLNDIALALAVGGPFLGIAAGAAAGMLGHDGAAFGSLLILVSAGLGVLCGLFGRQRKGYVAAAISGIVIAAYIAILVIGDALS